MALDYYIYASELAHPLDYDSLRTLLISSNRNNARADLTGFLHIEGHLVLQYLEGPPDSLQHTINRIETDPRHTCFIQLERGALEQRFFEGWNMAMVENATLSLSDIVETPLRCAADMCNIITDDLISLLSANASYMLQQPGLVAQRA